MARFDVHRSPNAVAALLALAAAAAPSAALAQRPADTPAIEALQDEISAVQLRAGENSAALIDPLRALGVLYQENGDNARAAAAITQAVHIVRVTQGLYTLEQAPLLRRLIAANQAIGDYESAWEIEQGLLELAERSPNDLRTARILSDSADARMDLLQRYNAGKPAPEIELGCYYAEQGSNRRAGEGLPNCTSGSQRRVRERLLNESQTLYSTAINIILQNESYASEELPPLLWDLVRSSYRYNNAELGRRSLTYLLAYQNTNSAPWLARIEALVAIADWDMEHALTGNAIDAVLDEYRQAYALLEEHQIPQESIDRIFSPGPPVVLPSFGFNPLLSVPTPRYVEVGFDVTNQGRSKHVRVLERSKDVQRADEKRLTELIAGRVFRPRIMDGVFPDSVPVTLRYYYR